MKVRISVEQTDIKGFLTKLITKYHFDDRDYVQLSDIYEQMMVHISPYAIYKINHRNTGLSMIDDAQVAIVALTLGSGVDSMKERFSREGMLTEAYMLDCIANELLLVMYKEFNVAYAKFHRRYVKRYVFIGDEISPTKIPGILEDIKGNKTVETAEESDMREVLKEREDIYSNEYGALTPSKSVVFYALLSDDPNQVCEGICMGCGNVLCENRMANNKQLLGVSVEEDNKKSPQGAMNYGYMRIFGA